MPITNPAIHQERRKLLIDATITAIAEFGLSKLTLAKISSIAGLTAGTVNFHFDSKESLLLETLNFVSEEFDHGIAKALKNAGHEPAKRLAAIMPLWTLPLRNIVRWRSGMLLIQKVGAGKIISVFAAT
jgi:AcrR family transcriptional regulator